MNTCPYCGHIIPDPKPAPKEIIFTNDGVVIKAMATPYNDAFYQIVGGKFNGNLIHITDILNLYS